MRWNSSCHDRDRSSYSSTPRFLALVLGTALAGSASAQDIPLVFLSTKPNPDESNRKTAVQIRPNTEHGQAFYLFVKNPSKDDKQLEVLLRAGDTLLGSWKDTVPAGKEKVVKLASSVPPPPPAKPNATAAPAGAPSAPANPWKAFASLRPQFNIEVLENNQRVRQESIPVQILEPKQYVDIQPPTYAIAEEQRNLTVGLSASKGGIPGTDPCPVRLTLSPDLIPGLMGPVPPGRRTGQLNKPGAGSSIMLDAKSIQLQPGTREKGYATVSVDGVERAFIIAMSHQEVGAGSNLARIFTDPAMRWSAATLLSRPVKDFKARLEVDNPPAAFKKVLVQLGRRNAKGEFEAEADNTIEKSAPRDERLEYFIGAPDGAIRFRATLKDWEITWDASDRQGTFQIRAQMIEESKMDGVQPIRVIGRNGTTADFVEANVVFDDTAPQGVEFKDMPATIARGQTVSIQAVGTDPESKIGKVFFFFGTKDTKAPKKVVAKKAGSPEAWSADLTFPEAGPVELTTEFVNGVGLSEFATMTIRVTEGAAGAATQAGGTKVIGKVVAFGAKLPQAGITVSLQDPKGMNKAQTTTNKAGEFQFKDVPPGEYQVLAAKSDGYPAKRASDVFRLEAGKTYDVKTLELR